MTPALVRRPRPADRPLNFDSAARQVLEHRAGRLHLLGGPGTGKTTVLVHAVLRRIADGGDPDQVLVLVGSRRAAGELRERIAAGLTAADGSSRTVREPLVRTVHSYAFGLLRLDAARQGLAPPRLLAGPEQDVVVRELLAGELAGEVPGAGWPHRLLPALAMPGFAAELRELLLRAAERGVGPQELAALGTAHDVPEWVAAGDFFRRYEQVTMLRGAAGRGAPQATAPALDAAGLVAAAVDALAADPAMLAAERTRVRHLVVDDAQDLDPQQLRLAEAIGSAAETFVLAGDPDQAVLSFRGADPEALRGTAATRVQLTVDYRSTATLRQATGRLATRLPGLPAARRREAPPDEHPEAVSGGAAVVRVFASAAQEAGWAADRLRRAHLIDGVPWSEMVVLVRSAARTLPVLRRAMLAAGVPMAVPADELVLARQPAVQPWLLLLHGALQPETLDADAAIAMLSSPLGGADPLALRRLRRGLLRLQAAGNAAEPDAAGSDIEESPGRGSDALLVAALRAAAAGHPDPLVALPATDTAALRKVGGLLDIAAKAARRGESVEQVLWQVWQASGLPHRWAGASARGGPAGGQADRDLDAVLALFEAAAHYCDRLPGAGALGFASYLGDQQIPGGSLAARAPQGEAVAVLTAHAARGQQWRVVAVVGVQEGSWPDLRVRGSLLHQHRLLDLLGGVSGLDIVSRSAPLLAEERRLMYLACTRAREQLYVSAVRGDDEQPSRFLDELDPRPAQAVGPATGWEDVVRPTTRPPRALVLAELVGELRRVVCDDLAEPDRRRRAAAQLARLAEAGVPGAHPERWYGLDPVSSAEPLRAVGETARVSPSDVEKIIKCPLRWALERHGGQDGTALPAVTGSLVHALVQASAEGSSDAEIDEALRQAWVGVDAGAPWFSRRELERVRAMLRAFQVWLRASHAAGLTSVAVERDIDVELPVGPDGSPVRLRGRVDRLEVDAAGRPVVIDVKTSKTPISKEAAAQHPQLAVYQVAAALGAFNDLLAVPAQPGGAQLLYLAKRDAAGRPAERLQPALDEPALQHWCDVLASCGADTAGPQLAANQSLDCERCPVRTSCPLTDSGRAVCG